MSLNDEANFRDYQSGLAGTDDTSDGGKVSVGSVILLGLSGQQVIPSALIGAAFMPFESGMGAWLSMLLAMAATLCVMTAINLFARRYVVTGSMMSYAGIAFGRRIERLIAASYMIGFLVACSSVTASTVLFLSSFLQSIGFESAGSSLFQCLAALVVAGAAGGLAWRGLDVSMRLTAWLAFLAFPLLALAIFSVVSGTGVQLVSQLTLEGSDWQMVFHGAIVGLAYFVGTDALASLASETKNPKKNIPIILNSVLIITGISFVGLIILTAPLMNAHLEELEAGLSPTALIVRASGFEFLQKPLDFLLICATFASLVAFVNYGSRVFATAGSEKFLPKVFSTYHPKYGSPVWAVALMVIPSALIPITLQAVVESGPLQATAYLSTLFSLFWVVPYIVLCIGAFREYLKVRHGTPLQLLFVMIGLVMFSFLAVYSFLGDSVGVMAWLPYVAVALTVVGYWLLWVNERAVGRN